MSESSSYPGEDPRSPSGPARTGGCGGGRLPARSVHQLHAPCRWPAGNRQWRLSGRLRNRCRPEEEKAHTWIGNIYHVTPPRFAAKCSYRSRSMDLYEHLETAYARQLRLRKMTSVKMKESNTARMARKKNKPSLENMVEFHSDRLLNATQNCLRRPGCKIAIAANRPPIIKPAIKTTRTI